MKNMSILYIVTSLLLGYFIINRKERKKDLKYPLRWLAIRLLCEDKVIYDKLIKEKLINEGEMDEIISALILAGSTGELEINE